MILTCMTQLMHLTIGLYLRCSAPGPRVNRLPMADMPPKGAGSPTRSAAVTVWSCTISLMFRLGHGR